MKDHSVSKRSINRYSITVFLLSINFFQSGRDLRLLGTASALQLGRGEQVYMNVKGRIMSVKGETAIYKVRRRRCIS